jgi:hypothetical protein
MLRGFLDLAVLRHDGFALGIGLLLARKFAEYSMPAERLGEIAWAAMAGDPGIITAAIADRGCSRPSRRARLDRSRSASCRVSPTVRWRAGRARPAPLDRGQYRYGSDADRGLEHRLGHRGEKLMASHKPPPTGTASAARIIDHEPGRPSPAWGRPYAVRGNLMGAGSNT